ncbi:DNA repair protein RadC [Geomonas sp. RF6]|uniref:RadC family protein n=1 Tax=Geomonas sp. RF6 TaxID=2897342 RepID=UPI001E39A0BA|nr:DNA repair protein RadC [Geomonas sp. RF6]UFS72380.1 DNA repair protein RadC [Geomonas sp. RF6]
MSGGIKNWPESEKPREKMMQHGADVLSEAELLALIIGTGDSATGRSALDLGRDLLERFRSLRELAEASCRELCTVKGMGPAKSTSVKAALQLAKRFKDKPLESFERFTGAQQVFEHMHHQFRDRKKEYFLALLLDGKNRIIRRVQISVGSLNQSIVHPREVFNVAVRESAAAMILMHNHPTGDPTPSREDQEITRRLCEAGDLMGIKVIDHIIIGDGEKAYYSFTENGAM